MKKIFLIVLVLTGLVSCGFNKAPATITKNCSLDEIKGTSKIDTTHFSATNGTLISFAGWAIDLLAGKLAKEISFNLISLNGSVSNIGNGNLNFNRPDIVSIFKNEVFLKSGFNVNYNLDSIESGSYAIEIVQKFDDKIAICPTDKILIVK